MNKWEFKAVQLVAGVPRLVELSDRQRARVPDYEGALVAAIEGDVSRPPFSNYFVRASVAPLDGEPVAAGNIEYGLCQAIHGEESAVAAFRSRYGNKATAGVLAFVGHAPGGIPHCCGNCRDIMRGDLGPHLEIVDGHPDGGVATVMGLDQCLVDSYPEVHDAPELGLDSRDLRRRVLKTWQEGDELSNDAYSPSGMCEERKYAVLVMTEGNNYYGGRDVMCDYHSLYALRDAVRAARRNHDCFVRGVVIVCNKPDDGPPDVMYKDRQHLMELNLQAELVQGKEQDPSVYLATCDGDSVVGIWRTTVKTWLPLAFSPRNFMDMDKLTAYFRGKSR